MAGRRQFHEQVPIALVAGRLVSAPQIACKKGLDTNLQVGSGEQGLDADRLELLGGGQHLGIDPTQLTDCRLVIPARA